MSRIINLLSIAASVLVLCLLAAAQDAGRPAGNSGLIFSEPSGAGVSDDKIDALNSFLDKNEFERLTSVVIAQKGKVVYERYLNDYNKDSLNDTRSATKTVTGMLIGIAIDKGFIPSVKTPALNYFEDKLPLSNPDPRKEKITIEDLLTMSSVLECNDSNSFSRGNEERMYIVEDYFKFLLDLPIAGIPPWEPEVKERPYGKRFSYCTAGTVLLGGILERSTTMKVDAFAAKYLFEPLGIEKVQWQFTPMGTAMTGGGLRLTSRDLLKLGMLYLNKGMHGETRVISKGWAEDSVRAHVNTDDEPDYGYLWWLPKFGSDNKRFGAWAMFGNGGNKVVVVPELEMVVVLTNRLYGRSLGHQQTERLMNEFIVPAAVSD